MYAKDAESHRYKFLDDMAEEKEKEGNMAAAKAINQRQLQEECRLTHRNVKLATKDFMGAPYQMELTTTNGTVVSTKSNKP